MKKSNYHDVLCKPRVSSESKKNKYAHQDFRAKLCDKVFSDYRSAAVATPVPAVYKVGTVTNKEEWYMNREECPAYSVYKESSDVDRC